MKCLHCNKEIELGQWRCPTGERHIVNSKRYFMDDAPSDPGPYDAKGQPTYGNMKYSQTMICNLIPEKRYMVGNEQVIEPGHHVLFVRGLYETDKADEQYYLDQRKGLCDQKRWEDVYLSPNQKLEIDRAKLEADRHRIESERNDLLAQVQALKAKQGKQQATA
jgi:hypothetical protein